MARKGGVFQALGNLWRWTIWGLAAVLVAALWFGWSNRDAGPDGNVVADAGAPVEDAAPVVTAETGDAVEDASAEEAAAEVETAAQEAAAEVETAVEGAAEAAGEAVEAAEEAVENTVAEVQSALEGAIGAVGDAATEAEGAVSDMAEQAEAAVDETLEGVSDADQVPATELGELAIPEGTIGDEQADLNILSPELSNITVPGDDATYSLISVFKRDDGTIEVVSDRTENGETVQTIRLVTCAPLAVGVISEAGGPRNDAPDMERISLGSAAATIAALACGAMN